MAALHYFFRYACIYLGRLHNYYKIELDTVIDELGSLGLWTPQVTLIK